MSIFKKLNPTTRKKNSTLGFYFGHSEAEGENKSGIQNLEHFFEDYLEAIPQLKDERFIFIGRKGAGKSAIVRNFENTSQEKDSGILTSTVRFNEIEHEKLIQAMPKGQEASNVVALFEWIVLVKIVALIVKDGSARFTKYHKKLSEFLKKNAGLVDIDQYQITELIEKKKLEVQFEVLKHEFGSIGKYFDSKSVQAPFFKLIPPLKEIVQEVLGYEVFKDKEFWILFDDLDINFRADDKASCDTILSLIRVAKSYNTSILKETKARVLLFVRDDVRSVLSSYGTDTAKIFSSYGIELDWYDHEVYKYDENTIKLKRFINKRIGLNFQAHEISFNAEDPWATLFREYSPSYSGKTSFKYLLDYTFYRPRDLILMFQPLGQNDHRFPLEPDTVKLLLKNYVDNAVNEIKSELLIYFTQEEVSKLFTKFEALSRMYKVTKDVLLQTLSEVTDRITPMELVKILLDYSLLILIDNREKVHIFYREGDQISNLETMRVNTHKVLYCFFNKDQI
jgi:hypothetical protein